MSNPDLSQKQTVSQRKSSQFFGNFLDKSETWGADNQDAHEFGLYFIKLFLIDLADRLKELRRNKTTRTTQNIIDFLTRLSVDENPVETLTVLNIHELNEFQTFIENTQNNLEKEFQQDHVPHAYQVLTENLETTAEYVNNIFLSIEKNPTDIETINKFISTNLFDTIKTDIEQQASAQDNVWHQPVDPETEIPHESIGNIPKQFSSPVADFGFELSALFSNGETAQTTSSLVLTPKDKSTPKIVSDQEPAADSKTEDLPTNILSLSKAQEIFKTIGAKATKESKSDRIIDFFKTLSNSSDYLNDLGRFYSIPEFPGFLEFITMIDQQESYEISSKELDEISDHIIKILENALSDPNITENIDNYIHSGELEDFSQLDQSDFDKSLPDLSDSVLEPDNIEALSEDALKEFTSELEDSTTVSKPETAPEKPKHSEIDDISFSNYAKGILLKVSSDLPDTDSGKLAETALSNLINRSEIIDALVVTGLPGLSDFGQFIQNALINRNKLDDITNYSNDIIIEIRKKLLAHFDEGGQLDLEDTTVESDFEKDVRKQAAEETEKSIQNYESYIFTILDQVKIQLQENSELVSYLNDISIKAHILDTLLASDIVCLKNFAQFTKDAITNGISIDELTSNADQIISTLVAELQSSDNILSTPETEEFDKAVDSLKENLEEPEAIELPSLTDFDFDNEDLPFETPAQQEKSIDASQAEGDRVEADYVQTFVRSLLKELQQLVKENDNAVEYIRQMINSTDIIEQLQNSTLTSFKEFSAFLNHAITSSLSISELESNKSDILNVLFDDINSNADQLEVEPPTQTHTETADSNKQLPSASIDDSFSLGDLFMDQPDDSDQDLPAKTDADSGSSEIDASLASEKLSDDVFSNEPLPSEEALGEPEEKSQTQDVLDSSSETLDDLQLPDGFIISEEPNETDASTLPDDSGLADFLNTDNDSEQLLDDSDTLLELDSDLLVDEDDKKSPETPVPDTENISQDFFNEDMSLLSDHDYFDNMPEVSDITPETQASETTKEEPLADQSRDETSDTISSEPSSIEELPTEDLTLDDTISLDDSESELLEPEITNPQDDLSSINTDESLPKNQDQSESSEVDDLFVKEPASDIHAETDELVGFDSSDLILDDSQLVVEESDKEHAESLDFNESLENFDDDLDLSLSDTIYNPDELSDSQAKPTDDDLTLPESPQPEELDSIQGSIVDDNADSDSESSTQDIESPNESLDDSLNDALDNLSDGSEREDEPKHEGIETSESSQDIVQPETLLTLDDTFLNSDDLILDDSPESISEQPTESLAAEESHQETDSFQPDEIQQVFLEEANEYIEKLNADLLELDKVADSVQPELVNKVLRGSHTIKGSAAMVQLKNISDLAHKMEDSLQVVRDKNLPIPHVLIDRLFQSADAISAMLQHFRQSGSDKAGDYSKLTETLIFYSSQLQESGQITQFDLPSSEKPEDDFELNEIQQVFLEEALEYVEKLNADLLELDKHIDTQQPELINKVLRGSHTIKGSAAMVQLSQLSDLAHKMEDSLQIIRDKNLKVPRLLIDVLFQSVDAISEMLQNFRRTGKDIYDTQKPLVETLLFYQTQLEEKGEIAEEFKGQASAAKSESTQKTPPKAAQSSVAEQTVRIDIAALNSLVNLSAELVIARNRLNNELGSVEKLASKFLKERQSLSQISKKIGESVQKTSKPKKDSDQESSSDNKTVISSELEENTDVLEEFSESEFDRFSEFDIISRDIKSSMLNFEDSIKELREFSSFLNQNIVKVSTIANDLNRVIVDMRMVPVKQMFIRFSRSVRDIAKSENKKINFITEGEDTKLDKMVMEEVIEPMMHIVRNSIGHGIESPEKRLESDKPEVGEVTLRAYQKGNRVILEVDDDGAGISIDKVKKKALEKHLITESEAEKMTPEEASAIIFKPGFSTAEQITSLHGRGVGLDVVHNTIRKLKGFVNIDSKEGVGTKFIISLPLTLAISDALLVEAEGFKYAIPLDMVFETVNFPSEYIEYIDDKRFIEIRGEQFELVYLNDLLGYESDVLHFKATLPVAVIELENKKVAVGVEKLFGKEEIVVKALGSHLRNVRGVIGATIRGDGQVILILDMNYLLSPEEEKGKDLYVTIEKPDTDVLESQEPKLPERTKRKRKSEKICVLAADDSPSVRKYIQSILQQHDIEVISVDDGLNALNKLPTSKCDIIITDLEMPRMNGFELVSEVRKMPQYNDLPIVIVTARAGDKHRRKGIELGANAFINKPFDPSQLVETIESFVS